MCSAIPARTSTNKYQTVARLLYARNSIVGYLSSECLRQETNQLKVEKRDRYKRFALLREVTWIPSIGNESFGIFLIV